MLNLNEMNGDGSSHNPGNGGQGIQLQQLQQINSSEGNGTMTRIKQNSSSTADEITQAAGDIKSPQAAAASSGKSTGIISKSQRVKASISHAHGPSDETASQEGFSATVMDKTVVQKDRNGTITVQSTKTVGKSNYSFVSVSPTKKTLVDSQQIKHIKVIQQSEMRSWVGLWIQFTQRPGQGNIHSNRKFAKMSEYFKLEDDRFKNFLELINRVRDIEEEKMAYSGMSQPMQEKQMAAAAQSNIAGNGNQGSVLRIQEFINFKMPKDLALINREGINVLCYTKPSQYEQTQFEMFFKMVKADAKLVKGVCETSGLGQTESNEWNILWTSQSIKPFIYEAMNEYQKINHFPMSNELTRKDRLCENVVKMQERFGKEVFNILPDSYILPDEFADFYSHFHSLRSKEQTNMWIIKPQNSSQGKGIYIIDDISEVPIDECCIISRYVANPFLINGLKFDLRLYVCITSMDPWRIYIYNEGLVRFASEPYDVGLGKGAKYSHLTNFSINKKNDKYVNNASAELDDCGHKWSLQALSRHLEQVGIDMNLLWSRIYDVVLKSLLCVDGPIQAQLKKMVHKNNCFELLGYDVLIDQDLKPWLMEVNLSPSLATESPLDLKIKSQLFVDTMNLACVKKFDRRRDNITKMKNRFKNIMRAKSYQSRQNYPNSAAPSKHGIVGEDKNRRGRDPEDWIGDQKKSIAVDKISQLNTRVRDVIRDTLLENQRKNNYIRIYPTRTCDIYDQYFTQPKQLHKVLFKALFTDEIIPFQTNYPIIPNRRSSNREESEQKGSSINGQDHSQQQQQHQNNNNNVKQSQKTGTSNFTSNSTQQQQNQSSNNHNQTERLGAPGSPSKRNPEIGTNSISLHPIIPEEAAETNGKGDSSNKVKSAMSSKNAGASETGGNSANRADEEVSVSEPYGPGRGDKASANQAESVDRNNSTAKSQKRQDLSRRKQFTKTAANNMSSQQQAKSSNGGGSSSQTANQSNYNNAGIQPPSAVTSNNETRQMVSGSQSQSNSNSSPYPGASGSNSTINNNNTSSTGAESQSRRQMLSSAADLQSVSQGSQGGREKLLITGDDVLIEYVHRLMIAVQSIKEVMLKPQWKHQIEKFIKHYVWHTSDVRRAANNKLWQRLESRLIEMKERRKRLLQNIYLREKNMDTNLPKINPTEQIEQDYSLDFQREYETKEAQKNVIIQGFSASQLEEMLRTSTRNVAYEVISCLIDTNGRGVLTEIIKFLTISNKHIIEVEENGSSILDNLNKKSHSHYGRHHNYYQNSKYGNKVPRIDESEEDSESYANINVNLVSQSQNPKKAYHGGSSSGMGISTSSANGNGAGVVQSGTNSSTLGSSQHHQVGSNNDIRIKIRKNSIEPHLIAKANHKQNVRQRILKEQQQRQMMQISSSQANKPGAISSQSSSSQQPADSAAAAGGYPTTNDEITSKLSSQIAGTEGALTATPRTASQRQASRSLKNRGDTSTNNANQALEDSQLSIDELHIQPQKSSEKTPIGVKATTNNLFDKSTSRDLLKNQGSPVGETRSLDQALPHSQISKTARCVDTMHPQENDGKVPQIPAAVNKHLNRDLIASSENLNDDVSPESSQLVHHSAKKQSSSSQQSNNSTNGAGVNVSRTNNKSQYLAKNANEATNQSGSPLEGLKDLKIRNEPRGRLGNFKKAGAGSIGTQIIGGASTIGGQQDESRIKRKELSGKIPSQTSVNSFSKQPPQSHAMPSSTLTNISSSSAAAVHASMMNSNSNNSGSHSMHTQQLQQQTTLSSNSGVNQQPTDVSSNHLQQPLLSPKKSKRDSPAQMVSSTSHNMHATQSPTPLSNKITVAATVGPISSATGQPDQQHAKQAMALTEKKAEKRSSHAAKGGKSHGKVIKRNLIQSSELASRDMTAAAGATATHLIAENGNGESHYQATATGGPKRSSNARGSSSKGATGAKANGNRQHKF